MLHDIGKLVLAACVPDDYKRAVMLAREQKISLFDAEMQLFGASHAEVGSYLMGLWGLPLPVIEAICLYRTPEHCAGTSFRPVTAVHAANILCHKQVSLHFCESALLDASPYLAAAAFAQRVPQWCSAMRAAAEPSA